ncbi:MAG: S-layer protein, partial [Planctomycetaceae bacterium]
MRLFCLLITALAAIPVADARAELRVSPNPIRLNAVSQRQQILITVAGDGQETDATRNAVIKPDRPDLISVSGSVVSAMGNGRSSLTIRYRNQVIHVPVFSRNAETAAPVHFARDVVPLLSKLGCNSGGCHGKASGQNGFRLSVFGFDVKADYSALTRESRGRRTFAGDPEHSLLILKAIGLSAHGGG